MTYRSFLAWAAPTAVCVMVGACTSSADQASQQATQAATAFNLGKYAQARSYINRATSIRDDVSDYWDLYARIAIAQSDYAAALRAYRNVISLDRSNTAAMSHLCELATAINAVDDDVNRYADQLLVLNADDPIGLLAKGGYALRAQDYNGALENANKVLARDPNSQGATILKAQALTQKGEVRPATALLETSLRQGGPPEQRLRAVAELYRRLLDRPAYLDATRRLAAALPGDADTQLRYADLLYQDGNVVAARALVLDQMRRHAAETNVAHDIGDLLLTQGAGAFDLGGLAAQAQSLSPQMKAALARYALAMNRADVAAAVVGARLAAAPLVTPNLDAKAMLARVALARGQAARARALVGEVLAIDPSQPTALLVRARIGLATNALDAAATDARRVLSDDGGNAEATLVLVDVLNAKKEPVLAATAMRDAMINNPADIRVAEKLARTLLAQGRPDQAGSVLRGLLNAAPVDLRVERLRRELCPGIGVACGLTALPTPIVH